MAEINCKELQNTAPSKAATVEKYEKICLSDSICRRGFA